ncbi:hypothetical protein EXW26_16275 [Bacillus mycoides]|uniref:SIR2 family protein n=1 Tax=Bacillus mycoides TaxID=1405 RepID=UPI001C027FE9|nr:SIR2 family protein [Bacillus mycoides]QWG56866.1 hypothetical protein EXW26_16275 [Bacillus mycoides]
MFINDDIKSALEEEKLVFFIGSGFSLDYFPDWQGLVKEILEDLIANTAANKAKYQYLLDGLENKFIGVLDVLEQIKDDNHSSRIYRLIKNIFSFKGNRENLVKHKKLLQISKKVITTNYDQLFENACDFSIDTIVHTNDISLSDLSETKDFIFKIHGDYKESNKCIFFKESFERLYMEDNNALNEFKRIITDSRIIFIGFSMSDPYVAFLFEYMSKLYQNLKKPHYILTTGNEDFSKYGVSPIPLSNWEEIDKYFDFLLSEKAKIEKKNTHC